MIELVILKHLSESLLCPVYLERPEDAKAPYVLFEKTGGGKKNHLLTSTFAFQSYSTSLYESANLNEETKRAVESLINLQEISSVRLNSDYNFTDPETREYRYQAVYNINHY